MNMVGHATDAIRETAHVNQIPPEFVVNGLVEVGKNKRVPVFGRKYRMNPDFRF